MPTCRVISVLALAVACAAPLTARSASDLWDERPLQIKQTTQPTFPPSLLAEGVSEGEVRAVLNVDAGGKLVDCLVTAYTRRQLAEELVAHARDWEYQPARQRGEPVGSRVEVTFLFQARGVVTSLSPSDAIAASANRLIRPKLTSLLCRPSELDEPVRAIHVVQPMHPGKPVTQSLGKPAVLIDFYIDMEGRPRMPVVLRATHEYHAAAAVEALLQWRFSRPLRQGRPVLARATQQFTFGESSPE